MTTFEELDLGEAFGDFGDAGAEPRRRSGVVAAVAVVIALALLVGGLLWARATPTDSSAVAPNELFPVLAEPRNAGDHIRESDLADLTVSGPTTRLVATTPYGTHYAALTAGGDVCLVTILDGDLPRESCAAATTTTALTLDDADGSAVVMLTASAPAGDEGWTQAAPDLWVRAA